MDFRNLCQVPRSFSQILANSSWIWKYLSISNEQLWTRSILTVQVWPARALNYFGLVSEQSPIRDNHHLHSSFKTTWRLLPDLKVFLSKQFVPICDSFLPRRFWTPPPPFSPFKQEGVGRIIFLAVFRFKMVACREVEAPSLNRKVFCNFLKHLCHYHQIHHHNQGQGLIPQRFN